MKLDLFDIDGREYYEACVFEEGEDCLLYGCYDNRTEAIKVIKDFKKSYRGRRELDCFVGRHDERGFAIEDYDV